MDNLQPWYKLRTLEPLGDAPDDSSDDDEPLDLLLDGPDNPLFGPALQEDRLTQHTHTRTAGGHPDGPFTQRWDEPLQPTVNLERVDIPLTTWDEYRNTLPLTEMDDEPFLDQELHQDDEPLSEEDEPLSPPRRSQRIHQQQHTD